MLIIVLSIENGILLWSRIEQTRSLQELQRGMDQLSNEIHAVEKKVGTLKDR